MAMKTNKLMARGEGGRFTGLSERAQAIKLAYEVKLDARFEQQMKEVGEKLTKNAVYSLKGAAYTLSQFAKASIVRSNKGRWGASRPGSPPHTRGVPMKSLKASIWYDVDKDKLSATVGPRFSFVAAVGELHEFGGQRQGKRGKAKYPKRPFMAPALEKTLPMIPAKFRSGLVGPGT